VKGDGKGRVGGHLTHLFLICNYGDSRYIRRQYSSVVHKAVIRGLIALIAGGVCTRAAWRSVIDALRTFLTSSDSTEAEAEWDAAVVSAADSESDSRQPVTRSSRSLTQRSASRTQPTSLTVLATPLIQPQRISCTAALQPQALSTRSTATQLQRETSAFVVLLLLSGASPLHCPIVPTYACGGEAACKQHGASAASAFE
jgi:hypothetical protein